MVLPAVFLITTYLAIASVLAAPRESKHSRSRYGHWRDIDNAGMFARTRRKRMAKIIEMNVLFGMRAIKRLLADATPAETRAYRMFFKQYKKPGDYDQAVKDFYSVNPTHVEEFDLPGVVAGKTGRVGDRFLVIESDSEYGRPIMEIYTRKGTHKERLDSIVYTDKREGS